MSQEEDNEQQQQLEKLIEADFLSYIDSYNHQDLNGVAQYLDEHVKVTMADPESGVKTVVLQGKENILKTYPSDFAMKKYVKVTRAPVVVTILDGAAESSDKGLVAVNVELTAIVPAHQQDEEPMVTSTATTLDVKYIYNPTTRLQVRHEISNVRQQQQQQQEQVHP